MRTALVLISTGAKYHPYIRPLLASARKFFVPHVPFLWTDSDERFPAQQFALQDRGFPYASLFRYRTAWEQRKLLANFGMVFHCDIDMRFVAPVEEHNVFSEGITAVLHAGYVRSVGTPERRPSSTAYLPVSAENKYFLGGFVGGKAESYLHMAETIARNIEIDEASKITAVWHDESHLQRFLYEHPPARILPPSFGFPEDFS